MSKNNESSNSGIGFLGVLEIVFITLKLLGKITWSWVWVLAPLWLPTILFFTIITIILIFKSL